MSKAKDPWKAIYSAIEIAEMIEVMRLSLGYEITAYEAEEALRAIDVERVKNGFE